MSFQTIETHIKDTLAKDAERNETTSLLFYTGAELTSDQMAEQLAQSSVLSGLNPSILSLNRVEQTKTDEQIIIKTLLPGTLLVSQASLMSRTVQSYFIELLEIIIKTQPNGNKAKNNRLIFVEDNDENPMPYGILRRCYSFLNVNSDCTVATVPGDVFKF